MEKRMIKKLLALLMIITILAADFFVLGSNLITYAVQIISETDNPNIEFSAYFKDGKTRVDSINSDIKNENLKLYAEIKVNGDDGYLVEGTTIEILNSNFNVTSSNKGTVEGNKVVLNQVSAGETVEVELDIDPIIANKVTVDMLSQTSTIKLDGTYKYSQAEEGEAITASRTVSVNYQPDEAATAELTTDIITNKVLSVNGENKRIVQLLIKSRLTDNQYPVESTKLTVNVPQIGEVVPTVSVIALGELATNGTTEISDIQNTNGTLTITLNNGADGNQLVNWNKNAYDELVVTFEYISTVDVSAVQLTTTSEIKLYNVETPKTQTQTKTVGNDELNQVVIGRTEITTEELYKGQLYENITATEKVNVQYETTTTLGITNTGVEDQITIHEGADVFATDNGELAINTKYVSTEINKAKMLEILGDNANIQIKNGETIIKTITKAEAANDDGNIVVEYTSDFNQIDIIITGQPAKTGILELNHVKTITTNQSYDRTDLQQVKTLKSKNTTSATLAGTEIVNNTAEAGSLNLTETVSKAELVVDRTTLSTTATNNVTLGVTFVTFDDQLKYDLYKNPKITLQFPEVVESIDVKTIEAMNAEGFEEPTYNKSDKTLEIQLKGEQKSYPASGAQLYLHINLDITVAELVAAQTNKITMTYTNENAGQYADVVVEQPITISAKSELVKMFNLNLSKDTSTTEPIRHELTSKNAGKTIEFEAKLINNTDSDIKNVKILGILPTIGNGANTLETKLTNITAAGAKVSYTEKSDATVDTEEDWTTNLESLANAKMYLIELETLSKGSNFTSVVNVQIPSTVEDGKISSTKYEVIYDTDTKTNVTDTSREIILETNIVSDIDVELIAQVGSDLLVNNEYVKEGEVIKCTATVTNNTKRTLENVELKVVVPEGTTLVKPKEDAVYTLYTYYEEIIDNTKIAEMTSEIKTLEPNQSITIQYELRVNTDIAKGTEILNKAIAIYNNTEVGKEELKSILEESNISVTIKRNIDEEIKIIPGSQLDYSVIVENLSNEAIKNLKIQIVSDDYVAENGNEIVITEIGAGEKQVISLKGHVKENAKKMEITAIVTESNNRYRSNKIIEPLLYADAEITLSSPQANRYIQQGEEIEYNINVKNTGNIEEYFEVSNEISEYLDIQEIWVNGVLAKQKTNETDTATYSEYISNSMSYPLNLAAGQNGTITVKTKVKTVSEDRVIANKAYVKTLNVLQDTSNEVTHILVSESTTIENIKNIISGSAWIDINVNGQKDKVEETLKGMTLKLYNVSTNSYLVDTNGNTIATSTDANGDYTFSKIPDGSYKVIFEYDMKNYEPTTYLEEGIDTTINSKALLQNITLNKKIITVAGTETINVKDNVANINIGLKEKTENPLAEDTKRTISGLAWLDANKNGQKDNEESILAGITIKVYDVSTNNYLKNNNGNIITTTTNSNGEYYITNVERGSYIVIFEYDDEKYEPTTYLAQGVDTTRNSKAILKKMSINGQEAEVVSTDVIELQNNVLNINIGLKEKEILPPDEGQEGEGSEENTEIDKGDDQKQDNKIINGLAWLDINRNGQKDAEETFLSGIKVRLYNVSTKDYLKDENGNIIETTTDANGKYIFNNIEKGLYILLFEYDTEKYEPTIYLAEGVNTTINSKVVLKNININGQEITAAVTDTLDVQGNMFNINIGLKEKLIYDLELNKYISRIVVQTSKETKAYDYENKTLAKVEIHRKQIEGSLVVLEYTIKVKNNGEMVGYAKNIVDYLPSGLAFSSELNKDWYLSGNYLYTKSLENVEINPGEEKEIKLILTKTMTGENAGLINNRAEIYQDYNKYGDIDIDSTPNNQVQGEDDLGSVDIIIGISTGGSITAYLVLLMTNIVLIGIAIRLMIKNKIIKISTKKERR